MELSGVSAHARALPQAPRAAWEREFSCPRADSSQTPRDAGQHSPLRKGYGHRRLTPGAPDSMLSVFGKSSHFIPTHPQGPHSPEGQTKPRESAKCSPMKGALNSHPDLSATKDRFSRSTLLRYSFHIIEGTRLVCTA